MRTGPSNGTTPQEAIGRIKGREGAILEHIASMSFGADSTATAILAKIHNEPLDIAMYCEVMFDEDVSGEPPEHRDFIYDLAIPMLESWGIKTAVLRPNITMKQLFYRKRTAKSKYQGKYIGFPMVGKCEAQKTLKLQPIRAFLKEHPGAIQYVGIAADEKKRLERLNGTNKISLLDKYGYTQEDARNLCREYGLLSPIYEFCNRGGCFFCPNAHDKELRHLRDFHPELWQQLLELGAEPDAVRPGAFRIDESLANIEERFRLDDAQISLFDSPDIKRGLYL